MNKILSAAVSAAALAFLVTSASAQQRLQVQTIDVIGGTWLTQEGYGCFDPLAALRFDSDIAAGGVSAATQEAFAVGSCVQLPSDMRLRNTQRISVEGQTFVRGEIAQSGVTTYLPDWAAGLGSAEDGYDPALVALAAPVNATAAELRARVAAYRQCESEGAALEARIADYNERAEAADPKRDVTGSRLIRGGGAAPVYQVILPDEEYRELFLEAQALQASVESFWARCAAYREDFTLDQDYLAFFDAIN